MKAAYDPRASKNLVYKLESLDEDIAAKTVEGMIAEISRLKKECDRLNEFAGSLQDRIEGMS
jgi:hypothetical protein